MVHVFRSLARFTPGPSVDEIFDRPTPGGAYLFRAGDTLRDVAVRAYGDPDRADALAAHNGYGQGRALKPGDRIRIPKDRRPLFDRIARPAALATLPLAAGGGAFADTLAPRTSHVPRATHVRTGHTPFSLEDALARAGFRARLPEVGAPLFGGSSVGRALAADAPATARAAAAPTARELRAAQRRLAIAGFSAGRVTGTMTPATERALMNFQRAVELPETGALDARTARKLEGVARRVKQHDGKMIGPGQKSRRVLQAQRDLRALGYLDIRPDGVYGPETKQAALRFRAEHPKLTANVQWLGEGALAQLAKDRRSIAHAPEARRVGDSQRRKRLDAATRGATTVRGEDGLRGVGPGAPRAVIEYVQDHLRAAGFNPRRSDGRWTGRTEAMVRQFQRRSGLEPSGRVNLSTWRKLREATVESNGPTDPPQRIGERSAAVRRTERRLEAAGKNPGPVDGHYTRQTQRAVDSVRRAQHLGHVGAGVSARVDRAIGREIQKKKDAALTSRIPYYRELAPPLRNAAKVALRMGLTVTSTSRGTHTPSSNHYPHNNADGKGHAIDVAGSPSQMAAFYRRYQNRRPRELFYDPLGGIRNGVQIGAIGGHSDHVHLAL